MRGIVVQGVFRSFTGGEETVSFAHDPAGFLVPRDFPGAFLVSYAGACYSSLRAGKRPNGQNFPSFWEIRQEKVLCRPCRIVAGVPGILAAGRRFSIESY